MQLRDYLTTVPDYPKPGILFYDISTLLADAAAWRETINQLQAIIEPHKPTKLAGIESRGFLLAAPLAYAMNLGFLMVRKQGKLPGKTKTFSYNLEYGSDTLEVQEDAIRAGDRVIVVDDLLATGGTLAATIQLLQDCGAEVPLAAGIIELVALGGQQKLPVPFQPLIKIDE